VGLLHRTYFNSGLLRRFWSNYVDPAAIDLCIGCTLHQTLENPRGIHVCENRGFVLIITQLLLCEYFDSYVAHEFCVCQIPIVSRVRSAIFHSIHRG
jgi:hypothetical protein